MQFLFRAQRNHTARSGAVQGRGCFLPGLVFLLVIYRSIGAIGQTNMGSAPIGQDVTQVVAVTVQNAGTLGAVVVDTLGVQNLDFAISSAGTTCMPGLSYVAGQACTVAVVFSPRFPGGRSGAIVLAGTTGASLATEYLSGRGLGPLGVLVPGEMTTAAGDGQWTSVDDGSPAVSAEFFLPSSVALDGAGNLYIADSMHNRIREVDAATTIVSTIAGDGEAGYSGDNGVAAHAALSRPFALTIDGAGNIYIADTGNNVIRKIGAADGLITTVAGNGIAGYSGDGGPAGSARLNSPAGIIVDNSGTVYIADTANHRIREVDPYTGQITTVAGNGVTNSVGGGTYSGDGGPAVVAGLNFPYAVTFDALGNMYIPDSANNRVRMVDASDGSIHTIVGSGHQGVSGDGGVALNANLDLPASVAFDAAGNLYIADAQNNRIRKVSASTQIITTIAGYGAGMYGGDESSATTAGLFGPYCVIVDPAGDLFIADYFDHRIREVSSGTGVLAFKTAVRIGQTSAPQPQMVENDGNAALSFSAITPDANAGLDHVSTTCSTATPLGSGATCVLGVEFAPSESGAAVTGNVRLDGSFINAPLDIEAIGPGLSLNSTEVTLFATPNPATYGQPVTLSAGVSTGVGLPTGTITFLQAGTPLGIPVVLDGSANASYIFTAATAGLEAITAAYSGDAQHLPDTSSSLALTIDEATATTLMSSTNPAPAHAAVALTATVASLGGGQLPTGPVSFLDGALLLGSGALDSQGVAAFTTSSLPPGPHAITAAYGGVPSSHVLGSTSTPVRQDIQAASVVGLGSTLNPSSYGEAVTFSASVSVAGPAAASGAVNFFDGTTLLGSTPLASSAESGTVSTAIFATSTLAAGLHAVSAVYPGSADTQAGTSALIETVQLATPSITVEAAPDPSLVQSKVILTAKVKASIGTPGGSILFLVDGVSIDSQSLGATGSASSSIASLGIGQHVVTVSYAGNQNYAPATSSPVMLVVQPIPTTTGLAAAPASGPGGQTVLTATVISASGPGPTGTVSFQSGATILAAAVLNMAGVATVNVSSTLAGSDVVASYPGDLLHGSSTSAPIMISSVPTGFDITVTPSVITLATKENAQVTLSLSSNAGFTDEMGLGCASLPPLVTCHFSSDSVPLSSGSQETVQLTIDTDSPLSGGSVADHSRAPASRLADRSLRSSGLLLPMAALSFWILSPVRRREPGSRKGLWLLPFCGIAGLLLSCGAISQKSAAPGSYVIQVVGAGVHTGITRTVSLTVNITR